MSQELEVLEKALKKYDAICYDKEEKEFIIGNFDQSSKLIKADTLSELVDKLKEKI